MRTYAPISPTSLCGTCSIPYTWYQRLPVVGYVCLKGRCAACSAPLSPVNPLIEIVAALALCLLYHSTASIYFPAYFLFFSVLLITMRTDIETMLISTVCTLWMIPLALVLSAVHLLPLSIFTSMLGTLCGYFMLYSMMKIFFFITKKQGIGPGDLDLLACIGAFTGPAGCWIALLIGSTLGSLAGGILMLCTNMPENARIPFGPFLALGAMSYVLWQQQLLTLLLGL